MWHANSTMSLADKEWGYEFANFIATSTWEEVGWFADASIRKEVSDDIFLPQTLNENITAPFETTPLVI